MEENIRISTKSTKSMNAFATPVITKVLPCFYERCLCTYHALGKRGSHEGCQAQVTDLDGTRRACNKDVVTLEVSVDYRGCSGMKEVETLQDLPTPTPQDLGLHHFKALQITGEVKKKIEGSRSRYLANKKIILYPILFYPDMMLYQLTMLISSDLFWVKKKLCQQCDKKG